MSIKKISINKEKVLIIGPIYDKILKTIPIEKLYDDNTILIFLGDICYPFKTHMEVSQRITDLRNFAETKNFHYVLGDKDLIYKKEIATSNIDTFDWLNNQETAISITFKNNSQILVVHGGVTPEQKTWNDLNNNLELCFVTNIPEFKKNWHKIYNGRFGYVVSSHPPSKNNKVEIHKHSISLDTKCYETDILAIQEINERGLGKTIYL